MSQGFGAFDAVVRLGVDHGEAHRLAACVDLAAFHAASNSVGGRVYLEGLALDGTVRGRTARYTLVPSLCSGIAAVTFQVPEGCATAHFEGGVGQQTAAHDVDGGSPCLLLEDRVLPLAPLQSALDLVLTFRHALAADQAPPKVDLSMMCFFLPAEEELEDVPDGLTLPLCRPDT